MVDGFDDVDVKVVGVSDLNQAADKAGLVDHARRREATLPARAGPTRLADENGFTRGDTVGLGADFFENALDMGGGLVNRNRLVFPVGQNVDGDVIDFLDQLGIFHVHRPDIGVGDGLRYRLPHLADVLDELTGF